MIVQLCSPIVQAVALLRQRCHGDQVSFANDERGIHILQPFGGDEAAARRARSEGYGRLNGDVLGACLLLADAAGEGTALIEQVRTPGRSFRTLHTTTTPHPFRRRVGADSWIAALRALQVCMQRDASAEERASCAAQLLERAMTEAAALGQSKIGVSALPAALSVEGAAWLAAAGFSIADEGAAASRGEDESGGPLRSAPGVVWRELL